MFAQSGSHDNRRGGDRLSSDTARQAGRARYPQGRRQANAAVGLMEPTANGIGGDLFAIIFYPMTDRLFCVNGSGRIPKGQTLDHVKEKLDGADRLPHLGPLPVTIPGTVHGWFTMHERFGSKPMADVLAPAIRYAGEGHPVAPIIAM